MPPAAAVSALIVTVSLALVTWHIVEWRAWEKATPDDRERKFAWRRFRRRIQASGMLGLIGASILIGASGWIMNKPLLVAFYWTGILVMLVWVMLLAVGDAISSRRFFRAEHRRQVADQVRFQAEILRKANGANLPTSEGGDRGE
jgi:hypothetical protein